MAENTFEGRKANDTSIRFSGKINGVEGKTPFLIGVAGGTASGKSTVCKRIMEKLGQVDMDHTERQVVCISQDSFYRELTAAEKIKAEKGLFNFDHPDAFNNELIVQTLRDILAGKKCEIPVYDYRTNSRCDNQFTTIYPADVVLFEGILVFYFPEIRELFHMKLFVDTDSDTRLARRVPRDIKDRGRDLDQVLNQYMNFVKPAFEEFCSPTKKYADVIIPRGADNTGLLCTCGHDMLFLWTVPAYPQTVSCDYAEEGCVRLLHIFQYVPVYNISYVPCSCRKVYIGTTKRTIKTRLTESYDQ